MKRFLKYVLIGIGIIILIIGGIALYVNASGIPRYEAKNIDLKIEVTPQRVARGKQLATLLCQGCHLDPKTRMLTGKLMEDVPREFGEIHSRNITQHPTKGIGKWTDGQIAFLLRTGIKPDGQYLPPYMVKLPNASDEDIASIIAFLHSDDPRVQPADVDNIPTTPSFLTKALTHFVIKPYPYPDKPILAPDTTNMVEHGRYLTTRILPCYACHSADFKTNNELHPEQSPGFFGGGNTVLNYDRKKIYTPNITFDKQTGIGNWTEDQFVRAMRDGFGPDNKLLRFPMLRFAELSDYDLRSMYAYLKTVPVLVNPRKPADAYTVEPGAHPGKKLYYSYGCQSCHGEKGIGLGDLRVANVKYPSNEALTDYIKHPQQYIPGTKMPSWDGIIKEADYHDLCEYVRLLGRQSVASK